MSGLDNPLQNAIGPFDADRPTRSEGHRPMPPTLVRSTAAPPTATARSRCTLAGEILTANAGFLRLLGFDSDIRLRAAMPRVHDLFGDHRDRARLDEEGVYKGLSRDEARWIRADGSSIWVRIRVVAAPEGRSGVLELEAEDVTGRRHLEAKLREAEQMATLGQLAGGMANDLDNMMAAILARLDLLDEGLFSGDMEQIRQESSEIRRSAMTASQMMKHLLSFCRGERLELRPVALEEVVLSTLRRLRPLMPENISIQLVSGSVGKVLADPEAVRQIVLGLAANAREAMPRGGHLEIRFGVGGIDREHLHRTGWGVPGDYGVITIEDTGTGMAPQAVSRLFEPFSTNRTQPAGPGLSMSMVYGIMKQHRGFVEVESEPGSGTIVRLYFRLANSAQATNQNEASHPGTVEAELVPPHRNGNGATAAPPARPVSSEPQGPLVLFVEDDESLRRVSSRILRSQGYRVEEAAHGLEALERIRRGPLPDLLITDLVMPTMTGLELVAHLEEEGFSLPTLLSSGYGPDFLLQEDESLPDHPFMAKPWTVTTLVHHVRELLKVQQAHA
jgi:PAS domain S-box-containing protein